MKIAFLAVIASVLCLQRSEGGLIPDLTGGSVFGEGFAAVAMKLLEPQILAAIDADIGDTHHVVGASVQPPTEENGSTVIRATITVICTAVGVTIEVKVTVRIGITLSEFNRLAGHIGNISDIQITIDLGNGHIINIP